MWPSKIEHGIFYYLFFKNLYPVGALIMLPNSHFAFRFVLYLEDWVLFLCKCYVFIIYMAKYFFLLYIFKDLMKDAEVILKTLFSLSSRKIIESQTSGDIFPHTSIQETSKLPAFGKCPIYSKLFPYSLCGICLNLFLSLLF